MKKIYISMFVLTAFFFTGCADDFLDVDQTESISTNDIELFNSDAGAATFVTSIYSKFLEWDMSVFGWIGLASITSDDADKGSDPGDTGTDKDVLDALTYNSSNPSAESTFVAQYDGINRCNQALNIIPKLDKASPALRERLMGEAKFLRAFMYFTLVKCYGGVPIVDHLPNPSSIEDKNMLLTRKTAAETYAFIEKDLADAIAVLPLKSSYSDNEKARASKGAAYALLAKVSLYQKKWQQVIDNADLITGYALNPSYAKMFRLEGENDIESLFEINGVGSVPIKGIGGFSNTQGVRGVGGWGWGFNTASKSLVDAYEPGDVRKEATIIFRGTTLYDGRVIPLSPDDHNQGYSLKAYSSQFTDAWETDTNIKYLRYGEVLLMKAEALNELNRTSEAIPLLNEIRHRAGLGDTPAVSQADVRKAIWKERRVELAFEFDRFFDLVRTGQAKAAFEADKSDAFPNGKTFTENKNELFPIPASFILQANGLSQQNPGY